MKIYERLALIRSVIGGSQKDFSARLGLSQSSYAKYEKGSNSIPDSTKVGLAGLGINTHWLLTGDGEMFITPPTIGGRLKAARLDADHNVDHFALFLSVSPEQYLAYENDKAEPPEEVLQRLEGNLNISAQWIRSGRGEKSTLEMTRPNSETFRNLPEDDSDFREALPDVYSLYREVQRFRAGQPGAARPIPEFEQLDDEAREAVADFARFQLARQRERESKSPPKPAPAATSSKDEVHEPAPEYGSDEEWSNTPLLGQTAAGPPLDTQGWPDEWRMVRLRKREDPRSCYLLEVTGTSMVDAGIPDRSLILVRRAEEGRDGQIVIAHEPQEGVTLKRLVRDGGRRILQWQDGSRRFLEVTEHTRIQGVFIRVIDGAERAGRAPG